MLVRYPPYIPPTVGPWGQNTGVNDGTPPCFFAFVGVLYVSLVLTCPQEASKTAPESPKTTQEGSKTAQNRPKTAQESPKQAQEAPKTSQRTFQRSPEETKIIDFRLFFLFF